MIWNCSKQMKDGSACQPKGWHTVVEPSNDNVRSTSHKDGSACQQKGWRTVVEPSNAKVVIYFEIAKRFYENSYELFLQWYVKCFFVELTLAYEKEKESDKTYGAP